MPTRRTVLRSLAAFSAGAALERAVRAAEGSEAAIVLRIRPGKPLATIAGNFIGLGYEMSSVARPGLLSAENTPYVRLLRNLGPGGVLRAGGIVSNYTSYSAHGTWRAEPKDTVVTLKSLQQLRGFLDATGWSAIWSLNFGRGSLRDAVLEAKAVAQALGPRLLAVELGNEVENYGRGTQPLRPPPYTYPEYRAQYSRWRAAIVAAVPALPFAAPDTAASIEWLERMAADAHGDVQLLTTHYYRGDQKLGTQDELLHADPALKTELERLRAVSRAQGIPWRMCETNSFFGGGRPGVSNTLAAALWTLDYMLLLAQYGCAGVNIETGVNQLGFISSYSPIQDDGAGHNSAGEPYYGMLAFAVATRNALSVLPVERAGSNTNLTVYALGQGDRVQRIVLVNKTADQGATVSSPEVPLRGAAVMRLSGPSLGSTGGVTLGHASVDAHGAWKPGKLEPVQTDEVTVPPASAAILFLNAGSSAAG